MAIDTRSFSDLFQDIVRNLQEIVRSEIRLAKTEVRDEASKAMSSTKLVAAGAASGFFGAFFGLLALVYALMLVMPGWMAALAVAILCGISGGLLVASGVKRFNQVHLTPQRTVEVIKEGAEWTKQSVR